MKSRDRRIIKWGAAANIEAVRVCDDDRTAYFVKAYVSEDCRDFDDLNGAEVYWRRLEAEFDGRPTA